LKEKNSNWRSVFKNYVENFKNEYECELNTEPDKIVVIEYTVYLRSYKLELVE